jgi:hypothetical protein
MVLTPKLRQLLALRAGHAAVLAGATIALRLANPVLDQLRRRLELARQLLGRSP